METKVLCPECFKAMLTTEDNKEAKCPHCETEFIMVDEKTVRYK